MLNLACFYYYLDRRDIMVACYKTCNLHQIGYIGIPITKVHDKEESIQTISVHTIWTLSPNY